MRDRASLEELLLACADKLANMRSIKADYMVLGDKVWDRFHRGKEQQSWYYSSLIDVFDGLSDYEMYWEISNLYTDVFVSYYLGRRTGRSDLPEQRDRDLLLHRGGVQMDAGQHPGMEEA